MSGTQLLYFQINYITPEMPCKADIFILLYSLLLLPVPLLVHLIISEKNIEPDIIDWEVAPSPQFLTNIGTESFDKREAQ